MKCIICHGEQIETKAVAETFRSGADIVTVDVTAQVCRSCGERYYDRNTIRFLEEAQRESTAGRPDLPVVGKVLRYGPELGRSASSR